MLLLALQRQCSRHNSSGEKPRKPVRRGIIQHLLENISILPTALSSYEEMGLGTLSVSQLQLGTQKGFITRRQRCECPTWIWHNPIFLLWHHKANRHFADGTCHWGSTVWARNILNSSTTWQHKKHHLPETFGVPVIVAEDGNIWWPEDSPTSVSFNTQYLLENKTK